MKSTATRISAFLGAALLCSSLALQAQTTQAPGAAPTAPPARTQFTPEQKAKFQADRKAAHEACKTATDKRACMTQSFCAKQADPAKCQAKAKEHQAKRAKRMDTRQEIAEACTGKRGETLKSCYKEQFAKRGIKPEHGRHGHHQKG